MKKALLFLLILFGVYSWADTGIYQSYVIMNGGSTVYYDAQASTANPDFEGTNLGNFTPGSSYLLQGGEVKTWKNNGSDVTGVGMRYRIYNVNDTPSTFTNINLPWAENNVDGSSNNQKWATTNAGINILSGLSAGNYILEVFFVASTSVGDRFSNNGGANYKAQFTITDELILNGIVTVEPTYPSRTEQITITLDASGTTLAGESTIYFHSGVASDAPGSHSFNHAVGNWGSDDGLGEMTSIGTDLWQIEINSVDQYYGLTQQDDAFALNFLFRSSNGSLKEDFNGQNYHVALNPGPYFLITNPEYSPYLTTINQAFTISADSNEVADWILYETDANQNIISTVQSINNVEDFSFNHTLNDINNHYFTLQATYAGTVIKSKSLEVKAYEQPVVATMPVGAKQGVNHNLPNTGDITFVLKAPTQTQFDFSGCGGGNFSSTTAAKKIIYLIGDFNNWQINDEYKLNVDGDFWWITLNPAQDFDAPLTNEYVYQYLIDGTIRIGDPYGNKVSDPDDQYINASVYPDLIAYPYGETQGRATVFSVEENNFAWQVPNFERNFERNDLNVYELHFRDFTEEGTYSAATEKLDYLKNLGINTLHVMPISEFEGNNSWGYNPNYYFAADKAYGTADDLREFIDQAHIRGIAVINDLVLNHAFYSNPNAMMYWDNNLNLPSADNPWFNQYHKGVYDSAGHWGADFNHFSNHTQSMVDDILNYWITEFKFDGFRFDFTKGFTQADPNPSDPWASGYDNCRVWVLNRMVNQMWTAHTADVQLYAVFEHLAEDSEDRDLANSGILMWSGAGPQEDWIQMAEGNSIKSFSRSLYTNRGFTYPNYMSYMESHDEERIGYQVKNYGANNDHSASYLSNRLKLVAAFNMLLPGPRMVWQFGELGYDISINQNGRTGDKPSAWELGYDSDSERQEIYNLYAHALNFRNKYQLYDGFDFRNNASTTDWNRTMSLYDNAGIQLIAIGNFNTAVDGSVIPGYFQTGTWYKYNGNPAVDGQPYTVNSTSENFNLYIDDPVYLLSNADIIPPVFNIEAIEINTEYCQYTVTNTVLDISQDIWQLGTTSLGKVADNSGSLTLQIESINGLPYTGGNSLQNWIPEDGENTIIWIATDASGNSTIQVQTINLIRGDCYANAATGANSNAEVVISTLNRNQSDDLSQIKQNALLALESKSLGMVITVIPENETTNNISQPIEGMIVYDENDTCLKLFDGTDWGCVQQKSIQQ